MRIALETLGCKLNQAETESLARQLAAAGHRLVTSVDEADIYILNTCTVTATADAKSRHLLRLAHRRNGKAVLVAIGCYAQRSHQELAKLGGVGLAVGNDDKSRVLELLNNADCLNYMTSELDEPSTCDELVSRTRAFIKIQDGCNRFCSYCIVPTVRGDEKSVSCDKIVNEVKERVAEGIKEVVLTGTEVGAYDDNGTDLKRLLERILYETDVTRLRLSSLQPQEITGEFINLWRDMRLCPHFHLSLQSGSDTVLRRMKRGYSTADFHRVVSLIRASVPDVAITTDVIAGFPAETAAEFEESYDFCRQMGFARIHIFPYSARPGTAAATTRPQVADKVKKQRSQILLALADECSISFRQQFSGRAMSVLWEQESGGIWSGLTGNYIRVYTKSEDDLSNRVLSVKLGEIRGEGVWGEICQ